jgi:hypothetical protein
MTIAQPLAVGVDRGRERPGSNTGGAERVEVAFSSATSDPAGIPSINARVGNTELYSSSTGWPLI